jgi:hypothetical protein
MVLASAEPPEIVSLINQAGGPPVGLLQDERLSTARPAVGY